MMSKTHCWRPVLKFQALIPLNEDDRADPQASRAEIWAFYAALKAYRRAPSEAVRAQLKARFDAMFTRRTRYETLNQRSNGFTARLHRKGVWIPWLMTVVMVGGIMAPIRYCLGLPDRAVFGR